MIPLFHDFAGETVLVVGGGSVGARKARRFAREARVIVVSPEFDGAFDRRAEWVGDVDGAGVDLVRSAPTAEDVAGLVDRTNPALVVAATDDSDLNAAVERAARDAGVLVNRTDESGGREAGSVVVPATVQNDPVTVAVSTGGRSPALSKHLRERLETELAGAGAMAELTADLRADLGERGIPPERRRAAVRAVVRSESVWKALRTGDSKAGQEVTRVLESELDTAVEGGIGGESSR